MSREEYLAKFDDFSLQYLGSYSVSVAEYNAKGELINTASFVEHLDPWDNPLLEGTDYPFGNISVKGSTREYTVDFNINYMDALSYKHQPVGEIINIDYLD